MSDPYAVLGVARTATQEEITHAYRRQLRTHHPDTRCGSVDSAADEGLRQILAAYALLRDPRRRAEYERATATDAAPVRVTVTRVAPGQDGPPLRAGPVRWHPSR
ncbi:J domain-containing protein [Mycobacterium talmoniae]|uniref:Molecular chaperone DnaJ n=1 Tax=Mycobacterium talmoniae TaxID=1858794 RepID=A0A1S1NHA5_9MYCO|nr:MULTISPECIES: J domain-containing protein [Mycobacterium]OHV03461.1 molecular chaperone DnaJ [Mycobacterium talmoniae]TDH53352.1 J domain-containing protein [Mycobacterium eburneum]